MARNYAALPWDYIEETDLLTREELGNLVYALMCYSAGREVPELTGNERFLWKRVAMQEDRFQEDYERIAGARSEAGKKSAARRRRKAELAGEDNGAGAAERHAAAEPETGEAGIEAEYFEPEPATGADYRDNAPEEPEADYPDAGAEYDAETEYRGADTRRAAGVTVAPAHAAGDSRVAYEAEDEYGRYADTAEDYIDDRADDYDTCAEDYGDDYFDTLAEDEPEADYFEAGAEYYPDAVDCRYYDDDEYEPDYEPGYEPEDYDDYLDSLIAAEPSREYYAPAEERRAEPHAGDSAEERRAEEPRKENRRAGESRSSEPEKRANPEPAAAKRNKNEQNATNANKMNKAEQSSTNVNKTNNVEVCSTNANKTNYTNTKTKTDTKTKTKTNSLLLSERESRAREARGRAPTQREVTDYCRERNSPVDPLRFIDYYQARGWKSGGSDIRDWKAALRSWERRELSDDFRAGKGKTAFKTGSGAKTGTQTCAAEGRQTSGHSNVYSCTPTDADYARMQRQLARMEAGA